MERKVPQYIKIYNLGECLEDPDGEIENSEKSIFEIHLALWYWRAVNSLDILY